MNNSPVSEKHAEKPNNLMHDMPPIILASGSPRRQELLRSLGLSFKVQESGVDEAALDARGLSPDELVLALSEAKALAVAKTAGPETLVIGADTVVVIDGEILGKPQDVEEAKRMLLRLQNRRHEVYTGITVAFDRRTESDFLRSEVWIRALSPAAVADYVATGEPLDKAGAYAIQGFGAMLVERIDGCYFNVVGMSLFLLNHLFDRFGYPFI